MICKTRLVYSNPRGGPVRGSHAMSYTARWTTNNAYKLPHGHGSIATNQTLDRWRSSVIDSWMDKWIAIWICKHTVHICNKGRYETTESSTKAHIITPPKNLMMMICLVFGAGVLLQFLLDTGAIFVYVYVYVFIWARATNMMQHCHPNTIKNPDWLSHKHISYEIIWRAWWPTSITVKNQKFQYSIIASSLIHFDKLRQNSECPLILQWIGLASCQLRSSQKLQLAVAHQGGKFTPCCLSTCEH